MDIKFKTTKENKKLKRDFIIKNFWSYKKDWGFGKKLGNWIRIIN